MKLLARRLLPYMIIKKLVNGKIQFLQALSTFWVLVKTGNTSRRKNVISDVFIDLDISKKTQFLQYHYDYELHLKSSFQKIIQAGDTVIDVGAHIGYWTLFFSAMAGSNGKVHAFEPHPENFFRLQSNIKKNKRKNCYINNCGISGSTGRGNLVINLQNDGGHYVSCNNDGEDNCEEVKLISLDDYANEHSLQKVKLVKVDVEGLEWEVLNGMRGMLQNRLMKPEYVVVEISPNEVEKRRLISNFLGASGYVPLEPHIGGLQPFNIEKGNIPEIVFQFQEGQP